MDCIAHYLPYRHTKSFGSLALDYIEADEKLKSFYHHPVNLQGIEAAIASRQKFPTRRRVLVEALEKQYEGITPDSKVSANIRSLLNENCFTVCTAHQPSLFTGYLYFVYKILHVIKIADQLNSKYPDKQFVPVFFLGSEDNDLLELNRIKLGGDTIVWETAQTGAVGRMKPEGIDSLLRRLEGELSVQPHGAEMMDMLRNAYLDASTIQEASFKLVHALFSEFGLVVLLPDNPLLKQEVSSIFERDIFSHVSSQLVEQTTAQLAESYKVQVNPREINLFYLDDGIRERIVQNGAGYKVLNSQIHFNAEELKRELTSHPEKFSPNVVLRGLFQEYILPNIAFVGGGSEIAYWLELKSVFEHFEVPFPVLVLRNSFLLLNERAIKLVNRFGLDWEDLFLPEDELVRKLVRKESSLQLELRNEIDQLDQFYSSLADTAGKVDMTLVKHVGALQAKARKRMEGLEKKMLRAEKRKYLSLHQQVKELKGLVSPNGHLQEREENILPYYARYGRSIVQCIYESSLTTEQEFTILQIG